MVKFWHVFCTILSHSFSRRSGSGPLEPVRKILVVRSGSEVPQFTKTVGTLVRMKLENVDSRLALMAHCDLDNLIFK